MGYGLYHGCGNSFFIGLYKKGIDYHKIAKEICDGVDGLILLKENPLTMIIYNADGSLATMCGNGIRCFVKFAYDLKIVKDFEFNVHTLAGIIPIKIIKLDPFMVSVNLGKPDFSPSKIGINTTRKEFINYSLHNVNISAVFLGTDHAVIIDVFNDELAKTIATLPIFTKGINVNFVEVKSNNNIYVKTYERGVGWTKACGTGASSSFCICNKLNLIGSHAEVDVDGGKLFVYKDCEKIILEGPAVTIKEPIL